MKRAKPNQASSHRKIRSGLIARHSSITRRGLYMWPSNVQLVRSTSRTRSSLPSALQSSSAFLMVRSGTAPYIEYCVSGIRLDVERLRAGQHEAVVVRLVAVAVDDARCRPACSTACTTILFEVEVPLVPKKARLRAEGARRLLLRLLDVAGRLQQAVEAAGGGRGLGEEEVGAVELAHVADPVRAGTRTCRARSAAHGTCRSAAAAYFFRLSKYGVS